MTGAKGGGMPRYFFNVHDDVVVQDEEGMELPDAGAARRAALAGIREMMCEQLRHGRLALGHRVEIVDEAGAPVMVVTFAEAVTIER
jgi:hypothetical protein